MTKVFEIDDGERHWYIAETEAAAFETHQSVFDEDEHYEYEISELPNNKEVSIDFDDGKGPQKRTCEQWIEILYKDEPYFLGSTVF
jgi:uncharacterized membrane protein YcgQ (UPF0703/DUF1980 family)